MVPVPSLPTDNLYKFMGMAGVVTVVASIVMLIAGRQATIEQTIKIFDEIYQLTDDRQRIEIELHDMILQSERRAEKPSETAVDAQKGKIAAARKRVDGIDKHIADKQYVARLLTKTNVADLDFSQWVCVGLIGVGGFLAYFGFYFWWMNVQKLQDEILKAEPEGFRRRLVVTTPIDA